MRLQIDVLMWRGAIPESRHRIQAAVADPLGQLAAATEQPDLPTTFRSAAKPFQLLPLVERGHADHWRLSDEELAVMTASHTGSPAHLERVLGILGRLGLTERHLACGQLVLSTRPRDACSGPPTAKSRARARSSSSATASGPAASTVTPRSSGAPCNSIGGRSSSSASRRKDFKAPASCGRICGSRRRWRRRSWTG